MTTETIKVKVHRSTTGRELLRIEGDKISVLQGSSGYVTLAELKQLERAIEQAVLELEYPGVRT